MLNLWKHRYFAGHFSRNFQTVRAHLEHVFGFIENSMHGTFMRCIGMVRTTAKIGWMNFTTNLYRRVQDKVKVTVVG